MLNGALSVEDQLQTVQESMLNNLPTITSRNNIAGALKNFMKIHLGENSILVNDTA